MSLQCFTYAYGIDIHSTICSLKLLGSSKRMCDSIVIRMISISLVSITIQCRLSVGNEESQVFAAVAENAYCYGAVTLEAGEAYTSYQLNAGLRVSF